MPTLCSSHESVSRQLLSDHLPSTKTNKKSAKSAESASIRDSDKKYTTSPEARFPNLATFNLSALLARFPNLASPKIKNKFAFPNKICYYI